jgi:hypothetical protein
MRISAMNQIALAAAALLWVSCTAVAGTKLLRPDVWHDRIVFSYAGDLWAVGTHGGTRRRADEASAGDAYRASGAAGAPDQN